MYIFTYRYYRYIIDYDEIMLQALEQMMHLYIVKYGSLENSRNFPMVD